MKPELGKYNTQDPHILSTNIQPISYSFGKEKKRLNDKRCNFKKYFKILNFMLNKTKNLEN